jgi:hypothetical protein
MAQEGFTNGIQNDTQNRNHNLTQIGIQTGFRIAKLWKSRPQKPSQEAFEKGPFSCPYLGESQERPKRGPREPKRAPRQLQGSPRGAQEEPRKAQEEAGQPQGSPRGAQTAQEGPRGGQRTSREFPESPRQLKRGPREPQRAQASHKRITKVAQESSLGPSHSPCAWSSIRWD